MIPARRTGKPFWDLYLYNDPPIWEAYVDCAKHFNIDALIDGYFPIQYPAQEQRRGPVWERFIVFQNDERIVIQASYKENGKRIWRKCVDVFFAANPPSHGIDPVAIGLPPEPAHYKPLEGVKTVDTGPDGFAAFKKRVGNQGLVGEWLTFSSALANERDILYYYDHPEKHEEMARKRVDDMERRFKQIMALDTKPDFLCVGGSGTLVFQSVEIFRQLALPAVKRGIELATAAGFPTHIHSCGPEKELVKIMAEETDLTVIDPLEIPPMGDCNLAELKKRYGHKIVLKGNLHTTEVMLKGSVGDVVAASKQAIDDAAAGGRFILSTGDQCGRDTPDENLLAMVETARTYGRY